MSKDGLRLKTYLQSKQFKWLTYISNITVVELWGAALLMEILQIQRKNM